MPQLRVRMNPESIPRWISIFIVCAAGFAGCAHSRGPSGSDPAENRCALHTQAQVRYGGEDDEGREIGTMQQREGNERAEAVLTYNSLGQFRGSAAGEAAYGILRGEARISGRRMLFPSQTAHTSAAFADELIFSGSVEAGSVVYIFSLDGAASGSGLVGANVYLRHGEDDDEELAEYITVSGEFASKPHAVTLGEPVPVRVVLVCDAAMSAGQKGESAARFTLQLRGIRVYDRAMRPVSGTKLTSASGTAYAILSGE